MHLNLQDSQNSPLHFLESHGWASTVVIWKPVIWDLNYKRKLCRTKGGPRESRPLKGIGKSREAYFRFFLQFANERTKGKDRISVISPFSAPQNGSPFGIKLSNFSLWFFCVWPKSKNLSTVVKYFPNPDFIIEPWCPPFFFANFNRTLMPPKRDAMFPEIFSEPISQQKDIRQIRDRDVFEAKLWLERTCRAARIKTGPMRPPSSIVYSCCNSAGIFPHSYGNVLGSYRA